MANGVNKAIIIGFLGQDPDMRKTHNGVDVANFSVATTESYVDKSTGERKDNTEWHRVVAWGSLSQIAANLLEKGKQVYVEGKLQTKSYEDREGVKKQKTEIKAEKINVLSAGNSGKNQRQEKPAQEYASKDEEKLQNMDKPEPEESSEATDDLPF